MKIKIQTCWTGHEFCFRALICGGLRVRSEDGIWRRSDATEILNVEGIKRKGIKRKGIRFKHV